MGDAPERIKRTTVDLTLDWHEWKGSRFEEILRPETELEGANEPLLPSLGGAKHVPVNQLRDPYVYEEGQRLFLLYSIAGEQGLALGQL